MAEIAPSSLVPGTAFGRPVIHEVLGGDWDGLGDVIRGHYFLRPFSGDAICVRGTMHEVHHSAVAKLLRRRTSSRCAATPPTSCPARAASAPRQRRR